MDTSYIHKILEQTKRDYNLISRHFSSTRQFVTNDLKQLLNYTKSGDKILDAGCGNGRLRPFFMEKRVDYYGIDSSDELIKIALERFPKSNFQVADVLRLPFPDNFFDKVYCVAVLHHIPSKRLRMEVVQELSRVLKPYGLLVITVWNLWHKRMYWRHFWKNIILKIIGKSQLDAKDIFIPWKDNNGKILAQRYIHAFTAKELKGLAEPAGFKIKRLGLTASSKLKDNNIYLIGEK